MSEQVNEAYLKAHNVRTILEVIASYLENGGDAETVLFAVETALAESQSVEELLGGAA